MIDNFSLGLTHALMLLAAWRLLRRIDLDREDAPVRRTREKGPAPPVRDLAFIGFLLALLGMGFRRPFLFVLAYVYIDIVSPQRITYHLLNSVPISLIAVGLAVAGWACSTTRAARGWRRASGCSPRCWSIAASPRAPPTSRCSQPRNGSGCGRRWPSPPSSPLTLRTRLRIEALLLFMVLGAASIIIVGGIKTIGSGGGYGTLNLIVANNSGLYEGSTISTVAVAIVPLIYWFTRHGTIFAPDWRVKLFAWALIFACLLIPVGTSTRTGLLCIGLIGALALRDAKRKGLFVAGIALAALVAVPFLPSAFTERMGTIKTYQGDSSASTRIAVWKWTWEFAKTRPMGGGFRGIPPERDPVRDGEGGGQRRQRHAGEEHRERSPRAPITAPISRCWASRATRDSRCGCSST